MAKRDDIQGIRGVAIAAVLAFHLNEAGYPAGLIGVDMFFVLSGYLMAVILSKETSLSVAVFSKFYTRRFKRIVPLYAILIAALTILVPFFLLERDVLKYCKDVIWAAAFATNVQTVLEEKDYFTELFDSNVLTHTWSLGVEIQYYLLVPFIVLALRKLSQKWRYFPFFPLLLIASFTFQLLSSPNAAFNLLPSRVWQFIAGGLSFEYSSSPLCDRTTMSDVKYQKLQAHEIADDCKPDSEKQSSHFNNAIESMSTDFLSFALIVLALSPWTIFPIPILRFIIVLMTSVLLVLGCEQSRQGVLLTNRPLVYLGDISYVVYLAHWPIIIIWKSITDTSTLSIYGISCCLFITFTISILAHHTIEQYFIRVKTKTAAIVVALLYAFLVASLVVNDTSLIWCYCCRNQMERRNDCVDDPEGRRMRGGYSGKDRFECVWKRENATGSLQILVLGNSISHIATNIIKSAVEVNFPQVGLLRLFAMPACRPTEFVQSSCPPFHRAMMKQVQAMRPDITFVIYENSKPLREPILMNATTDKATADFMAFLQPITNASRFVVLDEFYSRPTTAAGISISIVKRLMRNQPLTDLKESVETFRAQFANYFTRLDRVHFPNLIRHNTSTAMCGEEKGMCWWYNRKNLHSYFTDHTHLTRDGQELLKDSYAAILRSIINQLEE